MLILVDWGTSNFRAILIDKKFKKKDTIVSNKGILNFKKDEFYDFLITTLKKWLKKYKNNTIILSGMIGSKNGWVETEYVLCSTNLEQLSKNLLKVPKIKENIYIVPGIKIIENKTIDIIRGEEVQVFGALELLNKKNILAILPGTHSKWVEIKDKNICSFKTNMTGEVFNVISEYTILKKSITSKNIDYNFFKKGVIFSKTKGALLNQIFQIRTQADKFGEDFTYSFLSGILIGNEIKEMKKLYNTKKVVVIGSLVLNDLYKKALKIYEINSSTIDSTKATQEALIYLYKKMVFNI